MTGTGDPNAHDVGSDAGDDLRSESVEDRFVDLVDDTPGSGDDPGGRRGRAVRERAVDQRERAAEERELAVGGGAGRGGAGPVRGGAG